MRNKLTQQNKTKVSNNDSGNCFNCTSLLTDTRMSMEHWWNDTVMKRNFGFEHFGKKKSDATQEPGRLISFLLLP